MSKKGNYTTYRGKTIDMDGLRTQQETTVASGNMNVNAKGDQLGPGGKIVKTSRQRVRKHYKSTTQTKQISIKEDLKDENDVFEDEIKQEKVTKRSAKKTKKVERETDDGDIIIDEIEEEE